MPKGLYARALIIIIAPIVILQSVVAFVFMERHWQTVTRRLSAATVRDIAAITDLIETYPGEGNAANIVRIAAVRLGLVISIVPNETLPPAAPKPFFSLLDSALSNEISQQIGKPFWIDTVGKSNLVEVRIQLGDKVLRVLARRSQTYASNSEIFIFWMVGTSLVLLVIAIAFLRNQIRPIQQLADAAESFGKGRGMENFKPRGAREVRRAGATFIEMRDRIERQIETRTTMLAGVSHDLRTVLTRFRLQLALMRENDDVRAMKKDVDDMQRMLEGYLAFARGDVDEPTMSTEVAALLDEVAGNSRRLGHRVTSSFSGDPVVNLRPNEFKRCIMNLVTNACRHGDSVEIAGRHENGWLVVTIDDDGPGIAPGQREDVFRPFYRLDEARNLDESGTGLGLPIARDIARAHGGDVELAESPLGGLRAIVSIPA
ncbi:ATP-binding protein [Kaistia algarum]|uniref:ATP-binding protein n=1 Tax=Kaistia algarum TaxID=2083279 RepID=UPI00224E0E6B|nr:ATP-binding protein [Kaistia algarum]MCX5513075.1 ATP-binding protein [Kaistia algarum]